MSTKTEANITADFLARYQPPLESGMPKHAVLREALMAAISDGFWKAGTKLPTEAELAAATPYSLGTVQRALRGLVEQGLVERRRGYGTYVPDHRKRLYGPWHCRFLSDDGKSFLPVFSVVLKRSASDRHGPWSEPLQQGRARIIRIDRRMVINDEFSVYSKFFVRADRFPSLCDEPLANLSGANLKEIIVRAAGSQLTALKEQLRQVRLPAYVCRAIDVERGSCGILVEATAYAARGVPLYYQELYVPPTERRLYIDSRVPGAELDGGH